MGNFQVTKSIQEINEKIRSGKAVVVTAEEMIGHVRKKGAVKAAKEIDVVTTGTFSPMCSSGIFVNIGHASPGIRASKMWINGVPAYGGIAAVDAYLGCTEVREGDPLNMIYPGEFLYGGGHVIHDLVAGKEVHIRAEGYGTHCYPNRFHEKRMTLKDMPYARLCNPRNAYQNYNCAVNVTDRTIYTYMGVLKARMGNANYATSGQLSPLINDPYYMTMGLGTRIFLGGGIGYIIGAGTQHKPVVTRLPNGVPRTPAGTLMVTGDLKQMKPEWLVGVSLPGYGCSLAVGLGVPIPVLNEEIARFTAVSDEDIVTQVIDYGKDYPSGKGVPLKEVSYAELKSGYITIGTKRVKTAPLTSYVRSLEVAKILKRWIESGEFLLGEPQEKIENGIIE
jgi:uncharacterized protein (DUF39 family)